MEIYKIQKKLETLSKNGVKDMAKGYSRQRIVEQLNEIVDILDARISMELIKDKEWNPEENRTRPTVTENGIVFPTGHVCESKCKECGKCKDSACSDIACTNKCQGHTTSNPQTGNGSGEGNFTALIVVGIIAAVVLIGTGAAMFVIMKKKNAEASAENVSVTSSGTEVTVKIQIDNKNDKE